MEVPGTNVSREKSVSNPSDGSDTTPVPFVSPVPSLAMSISR
jgi:hypothetical protein